jgi:hypothetical protein
VLKGSDGPEKEKIAEDRKNVQNDELHNMYILLHAKCYYGD